MLPTHFLARLLVNFDLDLVLDATGGATSCSLTCPIRGNIRFVFWRLRPKLLVSVSVFAEAEMSQAVPSGCMNRISLRFVPDMVWRSSNLRCSVSALATMAASSWKENATGLPYIGSRLRAFKGSRASKGISRFPGTASPVLCRNMTRSFSTVTSRLFSLVSLIVQRYNHAAAW
jgi:hypothetical protein